MFYLGTHEPSWLRRLVDIPLFVSRRRLARIKNPYPATTRWALDSGGFTELDDHGQWTITPHHYAAEVRRYHDGYGQMDWAAPMDWMCEPHMLAKTGLTVTDHQRLTIENYLDLVTLWPDGPFIPVLQGWETDDYRRHVDQYATYGVDLETMPIVGLGSVCRRQAMGPAEEIVHALHPIRLHGFGMKGEGVARYGALLASCDSMAWSLGGRKRPGSTCPKRSCSNCLHRALEWRDEVLSPTKPSFWAGTPTRHIDPNPGDE